MHTYDAVSLLDLSHSLRMWAEMKAALRHVAPAFATGKEFRTGIPARKVLQAARGHRYVFSYMPGGVRTYACNGTLVSGPDISGGGTVGVAFRAMPPLVELGKFCYVSTAFEQPLVKALEAEQVTRCDYSQWMAAEAVRLCYEQADGRLEAIALSREIVIKRVANALDGSPELPLFFEPESTASLAMQSSRGPFGRSATRL